MLRLAFVGPRPLVVSAARKNISRGAVREGGPRSFAQKSQRGKPETGSGLSSRGRPGELRAPLWNGLAVATRRRVIPVGRSTGARDVDQPGAARTGRPRSAHDLAAEAFPSG